MKVRIRTWKTHLINKLKIKILNWLGLINAWKHIYDLETKLELVIEIVEIDIGVDVHFKEPHMIIIFSKLKGGQIRHMPVHFETISELNDFVRHLKHKYKTEKVTWDVPPGMKRFF